MWGLCIQKAVLLGWTCTGSLFSLGTVKLVCSIKKKRKNPKLPGPVVLTVRMAANSGRSEPFPALSDNCWTFICFACAHRLMQHTWKRALIPPTAQTHVSQTPADALGWYRPFVSLVYFDGRDSSTDSIFTKHIISHHLLEAFHQNSTYCNIWSDQTHTHASISL